MSALVQQLAKLSTAEDFLKYFGVPYEQSELNTTRRHVLERFHQYMRQEENLDITNETEMFRKMRQLLMKSYEE